MTMFSGATAEPMRAYPHHDRHPSDQLHSYAVPPRPTYRPQAQNLPRLHDILTSGPPEPRPHTYSSGWNATNGPNGHQNGESYNSNHSSWHPPLAHPPHEQAQSYPPPPQNRHLELPILETSPVARHDSHTIPLSPYPAYRDASRDYRDPRRDRARQASTSAGSYIPNGVPSPYTPAGHDDTAQQYRSPVASLERPSSSAFGQSAAESIKNNYLGVTDVPGEGSFHMYEGGFRIPTHVDGETVNPAWGLTKANKPRKRLAMACLDCREKKIKCEPGTVSCLQCEKAQRPCRKAPTHQSQAEPSATTPAWQSSTAGSPGRKPPTDLSPRSGTAAEPDTVSKRPPAEEPSPGVPAKKHRSASPMMTMNGSVAPVVNGINGTNGTNGVNGMNHQVSPVLPRSPGKVVSIEEDPFSMEPQMTVHLVERYFAAVNNVTCCIFPPHHFMRWLTAYPRKCQNERMVLYAIIALGSVFADDCYSGYGKHCFGIATEAALAKASRLNMALVQTRLMLGLYQFAKGANSSAWDYVGSGINAATYLRFHTEAGCQDDSEPVQKERNEFGLSKEQLVECKRRTLWSGFLMDRYCGAAHSLVNPQDIFIQLPCTDEAYERSMPSKAPFYNNGIIDSSRAIITPSSDISPMGWLILVAATWGDVVNFISRAVHRSPISYEDAYEQFYEKTRAALQDWKGCLPEYLQLSQANIERSIHEGYVGPLTSMHVLYHLSFLKTNRFVRHACITKSIARNVLATHRHAHELLQVMSILGTAKEALQKEGHQITLTLRTPFVGYAILAAVDVVGAGGLDSNLKTTLDLINCGLQSLRELGGHWDSARDQHKACEKRYYQIHNVLKHPFTAHSGCWLGREWGVDSSLEREFDLKDDCIYGVSNRDYFDALKDETPLGRPPNGSVRMG
ncbi:hypothetical protein M409DRAFT_70293 [Zasmidium cellare ATCC 36951]|uniref:Zn(2)-C6 fungal-type domain-containing protein n=1 Tax=Zasmidium cellare ATCC 36951 TaxID=1080233 RepID=A0A6A6C4J2_ZASCE|nr:uncharacterized protein M409DRAFT_70293 [Zasmidium cellare ATCC 36951]KAF2160772.1 hypothetical protein M409DRAFT_70293 [Zasmidium cellare ATCC 36951]